MSAGKRSPENWQKDRIKKKTYTILVRHGILIGTKCGNIRKRERETTNDQN